MNQFSVLTHVPEFTKGLVREIRVRWALEEMGLDYEAVKYPHPETKKDEYLTKQPFGQVPYFSSGDLTMFESGAILLHLALKHGKLLPGDENERARVFSWFFAALNSIEPFGLHHFMLKMDPESPERMKEKARELLKNRLGVVARGLGERDFFGEEFSIADIVMTTVCRNMNVSNLLEDFPNLTRYTKRMETRPAFMKALNEHEKLYQESV